MIPGSAPPATRSSRPTISHKARRIAAFRRPLQGSRTSPAMQHPGNAVAGLVKRGIGEKPGLGRGRSKGISTMSTIPPRPGMHDDDTVCQEHGLVDPVGHQ